MKKSKTEQPKKSEIAELHKSQKFLVQRINRRQIKKAPYNPRQIDNHAKKKLKENIKKKGLLDTLVWNKRTGNLVSGHQRISSLDDLAGSDNYLLDVAVVDLSISEEMEQNIFFNNPDTQGTFDVDGLGKMLVKDDVDYQRAGFEDMTMQVLFEGTPYMVTMFDTDDAPGSVKDDLEQLAEIQRMKRERKEHRERDQSANDTEHNAICVFPDRDSQGEFMERLGMTKNDRYVDGVRLMTALEAAKPQTKTKNGEEFEQLSFWLTPKQKKAVEDELVRIGAKLKGKNIAARALEAIASISTQVDTDDIEVEDESPKKKRKVS